MKYELKERVKRIIPKASLIIGFLAAIGFCVSLVFGPGENENVPENGTLEIPEYVVPASDIAPTDLTGRFGPESSKKGIQLRYDLIGDALDMGIDWGLLNFSTKMLSAEPTDYYVEYEGITLYFEPAQIWSNDIMIKRLTDAGVHVAASFVNNYREDFPESRLPGVEYSERSQYYAFNTATEEGRIFTEAFATFFVERYTSGEYGIVTDWLIGNEVNDNLQYHYMDPCDMETYVSQYYEEFKLFYNVIRKYDSNAEVFIPMEHRWQTANTMTDYGGRQFLEYFHELEMTDQQMDWGLAWHPYPYPLGDPDTLDDGDEPTIDTDGSPTYGGEVTKEYTTPLVSMKNIEVIVDYLKTHLSREDGTVRSIILSEVGYTSNSVIVGQNEAKQAANIAFAYYKTQFNPYIKALIIRSAADEYEGSPYFQFGMRYGDGDNYMKRKLAYNVYKYIDTDRAGEVSELALSVLGLENWESEVPGFDKEQVEKLGAIRETEILFNDEAEPDDLFEANKKDAGALEKVYVDEFERIYQQFGMVAPADLFNENKSADMLGIKFCFTEVLSYQIRAEVHIISGKNEISACGLLDEGVIDGVLAVPLPEGFSIADSDTVQVELWISDVEGRYRQLFDFKQCEAYIGTGQNLTDLQKSGFRDIVLNEEKKDISEAAITQPSDEIYVGEYYKPQITVKDGDIILQETVDYALSYTNNREPGTAQITVVGVGDYKGFTTVTFQIIGEYGDVLNPKWYFEHNPEAESACGGDPAKAEEYFLKSDIDAGVQGCKDFNVFYYRSNYPELIEEYGDNLRECYLHYINVGKKEGRVAAELLNPALYQGFDYTPVYDEYFMRDNYWETCESFGFDSYRILQYFVEELMPNGKKASDWFSPEVYRSSNADLSEAFGDDWTAYYQHYCTDGYKENRKANEFDASENTGTVYQKFSYADVFDAGYYTARYEDAAEYAQGDSARALEHFVIWGMKEGRQGCREFDPCLYRARYSDIRNMYGSLMRGYYLHYITVGKSEGR